jgi:hypothetical protein
MGGSGVATSPFRLVPSPGSCSRPVRHAAAADYRLVAVENCCRGQDTLCLRPASLRHAASPAENGVRAERTGIETRGHLQRPTPSRAPKTAVPSWIGSKPTPASASGHTADRLFAACGTWCSPSTSWPPSGSRSCSSPSAATPRGRRASCCYNIVSAMAEFERSLLIERVKSGVAAARLHAAEVPGRKTPCSTRRRLPS